MASPDLPFGSFLVVANGPPRVLLLVNDRGPYVAGRVLDLSHAGGDLPRRPASAPSPPTSSARSQGRLGSVDFWRRPTSRAKSSMSSKPLYTLAKRT